MLSVENVECSSHMSVRGGVTDFVTFAIQWLEQVDCGFMLMFHQYGWTPSAASCGSSLLLDRELLILDTSNHLLLRYSS